MTNRFWGWSVRSSLAGAAMLALVLLGTSRPAASDEAAEKARTIALSRGRMELTAPKSWERRQPQTRIVEYEFAAKPVEGDKDEARITIMGAGGGVEANIERWIGQFEQPDGTSSKEKTKVDKRKIGDVEVHTVSITGTYKDRPGGGPFTNTPVVKRENYRMLGAILVTENMEHYYIKMYGPKNTVDAQEKAFQEMVESLKVK